MDSKEKEESSQSSRVNCQKDKKEIVEKLDEIYSFYNRNLF